MEHKYIECKVIVSLETLAGCKHWARKLGYSAEEFASKFGIAVTDTECRFGEIKLNVVNAIIDSKTYLEPYAINNGMPVAIASIVDGELRIKEQVVYYKYKNFYMEM